MDPDKAVWTAVESGHLTEVGWDGSSLWARFRNGSTYVYAGVPDGVYRQIVGSRRPGQAFVELVRSRFPGQKWS